MLVPAAAPVPARRSAGVSRWSWKARVQARQTHRPWPAPPLPALASTSGDAGTMSSSPQYGQ
jgi:hypothetical protein